MLGFVGLLQQACAELATWCNKLNVALLQDALLPGVESDCRMLSLVRPVHVLPCEPESLSCMPGLLLTALMIVVLTSTACSGHVTLAVGTSCTMQLCPLC